MKFQMKQMLAAFAVAASFISAASYAAPFGDFIVNEGSVPGTPASVITADKINGGYSERISFSGGNFATNGYADWGQYFANEGTTLVNAQLNTTYGMYALFSANGTVGSPAPGFTTFNPIAAAFFLYIDPNQDTTKTLGATGADAVTVANNADDYLIALASNLTTGGGVLTPIGGFFDLNFDDFALTAAGAGYFISPDPFYVHVNIDGDFDNFQPVGNQTVTGDISAVFLQVPEPSTIALLGLGLMTLGFRLRNRA